MNRKYKDYCKFYRKFKIKDDDEEEINKAQLAIEMMPHDYKFIFKLKWKLEKGNYNTLAKKLDSKTLNKYYKLESTDIDYLYKTAEKMFKNIKNRFLKYYIYKELSSNLEYQEALYIVCLLDDIYYGITPENIKKRYYYEFKEIVSSYLNSINEGDKEIIILYFGGDNRFERMDYGEIAHKFKIEEKTVKNIVKKCKDELKEILMNN